MYSNRPAIRSKLIVRFTCFCRHSITHCTSKLRFVWTYAFCSIPSASYFRPDFFKSPQCCQGDECILFNWSAGIYAHAHSNTNTNTNLTGLYALLVILRVPSAWIELSPNFNSDCITAKNNKAFQCDPELNTTFVFQRHCSAVLSQVLVEIWPWPLAVWINKSFSRTERGRGWKDHPLF